MIELPEKIMNLLESAEKVNDEVEAGINALCAKYGFMEVLFVFYGKMLHELGDKTMMAASDESVQ